MSSRRAKKGNNKQKRGFAFFIFPLLSLAVAIYCVLYIVQWFGENGVNKEVLQGIVEETVQVDKETGTTKIDFAALKAKNNESVRMAQCKGN